MRNLYYLLKMARLSLPYKFRKYITILLFVILGFFLFQSVTHAADPNDFRKPNMWANERTINDAVNKTTVEVRAARTYPVSTLGADGKPIKQMRTARATVKLGAASANVSKSLVKRIPAIAITQAVIAILGKSVDWVLDPENNSVKYKDDPTDGGDYVIGCSEGVVCNKNTYIYKQKFSPAAALDVCKYLASTTSRQGVVTVSGPNCIVAGVYSVGSIDTVNFPSIPSDWQHIPISDVAAKVINHAEDGQAPAMQVMNDAALDALEAGLLDAQLDAASNVPQPDPQEITQAQYDNPDYPENGTGTGTGPETPVDPETPTDPVDPNPNPNPDANPFQLPPFCSWASKVCDFIDWVKTEPPDGDGDGDIELEKPDPDMHVGILERLYINMPAVCPPDPILEFMGAKIPFPMSVFCQFAAMMKPLILLFAYIKGLSIIGNGLS